MATDYRLYVDGKRGWLNPGTTPRGNPRCINCLKPIPKHRRSGPYHSTHPSLFCTDLCAISYGEYVAHKLLKPSAQNTKAAEIVHPDESSGPDISDNEPKTAE